MEAVRAENEQLREECRGMETTVADGNEERQRLGMELAEMEDRLREGELLLADKEEELQELLRQV